MSDDAFFEELAGRNPTYDPLGGHADDSEWALIRKLLKAAGGTPVAESALLARFRADCPGHRWPNLGWLHARVDLPVLFARRRVPFQAEALVDVAKRFARTPCYTAWADALAAHEGTTGEHPDRPLALAFRWPGWGDLVLHNRADDLPEDGTCVVHYHHHCRFVIEPVAGFLARLRWPPPDEWV